MFKYLQIIPLLPAAGKKIETVYFEFDQYSLTKDQEK
jgi:hypothetical protein